jgi:hypothetical protein
MTTVEWSWIVSRGCDPHGFTKTKPASSFSPTAPLSKATAWCEPASHAGFFLLLIVSLRRTTAETTGSLGPIGMISSTVMIVNDLDPVGNDGR